jgi:hypothetical protein
MLMEDLWEDFGFVMNEDEVSKYQYPLPDSRSMMKILLS